MKHSRAKNQRKYFSATLALAMMALGCLEVPIIHVEPEPSDAGDADVSRQPISDATNDAPDPCEACLRAPSREDYGCGNEMDACSADPQCAGTIGCAIPQGCFRLPDQSSIINCGIPCAREAGLDVSSPSLQLVIAVVTCGETTCGPICRGEVDAAVR
jgi:hypothetical protein